MRVITLRQFYQEKIFVTVITYVCFRKFVFMNYALLIINDERTLSF